MTQKIPAEHFVATLAANVDNLKLDDKGFREFVRNTLPIVQGADNRQVRSGDGGAHTDDGCWQQR